MNEQLVQYLVVNEQLVQYLVVNDQLVQYLVVNEQLVQYLVVNEQLVQYLLVNDQLVQYLVVNDQLLVKDHRFLLLYYYRLQSYNQSLLCLILEVTFLQCHIYSKNRNLDPKVSNNILQNLIVVLISIIMHIKTKS